MSIPATLPPESRMKSTMKIFRGFDSFVKFFDEIEVEDRSCGSNTYLSLMQWVMGVQADEIRKRNQKYVGTKPPFPSSVEQAMDRTTYQQMDEFNQYYKDVIEPEASNLLNDSKAALDVPVIKYNDKQLGFFDFTRASSGLFPKYAYYSLKLKKIVEGNLVETYKDGKKFKYRLKQDGSPCVIMPMVAEGVNEEQLYDAAIKISEGEAPLKALKEFKLKLGGFSSTIKKTYVYQEVAPKPKNSIRLFISIGGSYGVDGDDLKWAGYLGVGLSQILEFLGYSVSIYFVYGLVNDGYKDASGATTEGVRFVAFPLKDFSETINASNLLYVVSDPTFFRVRFWQYIIKISQYYGDNLDKGLGRSLQEYEKQILDNAIYRRFSTIDPLFIDGVRNPECPFLYYIIGNCHSEEKFREYLRDTILGVVNENRLAREEAGLFIPDLERDEDYLKWKEKQKERGFI
jgi:hypothetical protein